MSPYSEDDRFAPFSIGWWQFASYLVTITNLVEYEDIVSPLLEEYSYMLKRYSSIEKYDIPPLHVLCTDYFHKSHFFKYPIFVIP